MFKRLTEISVHGLNQLRLLNKLTASGCRLYKIDKLSPSEMRITAARKESAKVIAIIEDLCYTYTAVQKEDIISRVKARFWLPIAAAALIILIFMSNMLIWRVEINGVSGLTLVNVQKLVEEAGIHAFAFKPDDLSELHNEIMSIDEVAAASVKMDGNVLRINIIESKQSTPIETGGEVVSGYDAVVTRIITESGTAYVKRGDIVRRGQILIGGQLTATADGRVIAESVAKGSVYGTVTFSFRTVITDGTRWVKTGNKQTSTDIGIFGGTWKGKECEYTCYSSVTTKSKFFCFDITQTVYEEIFSESLGTDIDAFAAAKISELQSVYSAGFDTKYVIDEIGGVPTLKLYLSAELCLGYS